MQPTYDFSYSLVPHLLNLKELYLLQYLHIEFTWHGGGMAIYGEVPSIFIYSTSREE